MEKSNHLYTEEQNAFLQDIKGKDTYKNIADKFNEKFGTNITKEAIRRKITRGLYVSHVPKYTEEQDNFIKEYSKMYSFKKVRVEFFKKYGFEITKQAITDRCRRVYHTAPTQASDKSDYNHEWCEREVGAESEKGGLIVVKFDNKPGGKMDNWGYKHHLVWEQHYGPVPKGYRVLFLDGNNRNFDIENLACVPLKYVCLLANNHWKFENAELTKSAIKWCELCYALRSENIEN